MCATRSSGSLATVLNDTVGPGVVRRRYRPDQSIHPLRAAMQDQQEHRQQYHEN